MQSCRNCLQRTQPIHLIGPQTHVFRRFQPFRYSMNFDSKRDEPMLLKHKFMQWNRIRIFRIERTWSNPLDPKLTFWGVLDHFVTARKLVQDGLNMCDKCTSWCNKVSSEFFKTIAPDPPHWTPVSCFGSFWTVSLLHELWCKMGWTGAINVQVRPTKLRQNFSHQMHWIHQIGPQTQVLERFGPFRYSTKVGAKRAELEQLMHKFVQRSRVGIFTNERNWSSPLDPKLMFWGVLDRFITTRKSVQNGLNWWN
jgi:hypothetical protein